MDLDLEPESTPVLYEKPLLMHSVDTEQQIVYENCQVNKC